MEIKNLRLKNFRNFTEQELNFESEAVYVFVGSNGEGKSNLLESIYYLTHGKSFRTSDFRHMLHKNQGQLHTSVVEAEFFQSPSVRNIRSVLLETSKKITLDGKSVSGETLQSLFRSVLFSPESLGAIKEGPEQRRNLIDEVLIQISAQGKNAYQDFKKTLKVRNKILFDHKQEKSSQSRTMELLESLEPFYLEAASKLTQMRVKTIENMKPFFQESFQQIVQQGHEVDISVEAVQSLLTPDLDINLFSLKMKKRIEELQRAELAYGSSLVGPHKHDIHILHDRKDSRFYSSQGQQRALILAFKIAQIMYHYQVHQRYPILLLDDVFSELDEVKRKAFIRFLSERKLQVFITATEREKFDQLNEMNLKYMEVKNAHVTTPGN